MAVAFLVWRDHRSERHLCAPAVAAAVLVPLRALLGAAVAWVELSSWIVAVHFVVGMLFFAFAVYAAVVAWRDPMSAAGMRFLARVVAAALGILDSVNGPVRFPHSLTEVLA